MLNELVKGRASCHKTLLQIYINGSHLLCVQLASYLERGPLMWKILLHLHVNQNPNPMVMMMIQRKVLKKCYLPQIIYVLRLSIDWVADLKKILTMIKNDFYSYHAKPRCILF